MLERNELGLETEFGEPLSGLTLDELNKIIEKFPEIRFLELIRSEFSEFEENFKW